MWNQPFYSELSTAQPNGFYKNNPKKAKKNSKSETDFDEEISKNLEEAFRKYRQNAKKKPVRNEKSTSKATQPQPRKDTIESFNSCAKSEYFVTEENDTFIKDGPASLDLQELVNYFFSKENKDGRCVEKTYADYEKQGAIPKNKACRTPKNCTELNSETGDSKAYINLSARRKDEQETQKGSSSNQRKRIKSNVTKAKVSQADLIHCNFSTDFFSGNEILTINEEICKKPFFYVVPNNPFSNFFFSPGSYYVIPKSPGSLIKDVVIFHPENETSKKKVKNTVLCSKNERKFLQCVGENNLGKDTSQKSDSHLNIGPSDSKIDEFFRNLETSCEVNKVYDKDLLNSEASKPKSRIAVEIKEGSLIESYKLRDKKNNALLNTDVESPDSCKETSWLDSDNETGGEQKNGDKLDSVMQRLLSEFPHFDSRFACEIAQKYALDENGLKDFIESESLKIKKQEQLERMILALPESNYEELQKKCEEFEGDENLVTAYITETQRANESLQIFVELQLLFPDADPDYLREKLEDWEDIDRDEAINELTNELLDNKTYPKISYPNVNARKKLWRLYVENFDVKNFILEVPNAEAHLGQIGRQANEELLLKFLLLRYPDYSKVNLRRTLLSNNYNLTRTCEVLSSEFMPVNLSLNIFLNENFDENFLKAIVYIERRVEIDDYLKSMKELKQIEVEETRINDAFLTCPLCCNEELIVSEAFTCPDGHIFCKDCIKSYISVKIGDEVYKFACPSEQCDTFFSYSALRQIIPGTVLSRISRKEQAEEVNKAKVPGLEFCPHCDYAYIPKAEDKIFKCQNSLCLSETCRKCGETNHIPLSCNEIERQIDVEARKKIEETMTSQLIRSCPSCFKRFVKIDGCNKMSCSCGVIMCYICRQMISGYDHFSRTSYEDKCPLYSNNEDLHVKAVLDAGIQARDEILQTNPNVNILYDPTK